MPFQQRLRARHRGFQRTYAVPFPPAVAVADVMHVCMYRPSPGRGDIPRPFVVWDTVEFPRDGTFAGNSFSGHTHAAFTPVHSSHFSQQNK